MNSLTLPSGPQRRSPTTWRHCSKARRAPSTTCSSPAAHSFSPLWSTAPAGTRHCLLRRLSMRRSTRSANGDWQTLHHVDGAGPNRRCDPARPMRTTHHRHRIRYGRSLSAHLAPSSSRRVVAGVDVDPDIAFLARARLLARGITADIGLVTPSLVPRLRRALPKPSASTRPHDRRRSPSDWVRAVVRRLAPDGRGITVIPVSALSSRSGCASPRPSRGRGGCDRAPGSIRTDARERLALCVLQDSIRCPKVLVVELPIRTPPAKTSDGSTDPTAEASRSAPDSLPELSELLADWRASQMLRSTSNVRVQIVDAADVADSVHGAIATAVTDHVRILSRLAEGQRRPVRPPMNGSAFSERHPGSASDIDRLTSNRGTHAARTRRTP